MTSNLLLVQYTCPDDPGIRWGLMVQGSVLDPGATPYRGVLDVLDDWSNASSWLRALDPMTLTTVPDATLTTPITYPRKVLCAGANYYSHAAEMGVVMDPHADPYFFLKPPTTTVIGPDAEIRMPRDAVDPKLDWEVELCVVIGQRCRDVPESAAMDVVAGYTVANDISSRAPFSRPSEFTEFAFNWFTQKGRDGFCPIGPGIVPSWLLPEPQDVRLRLTVNGAQKQDHSTADMIIPISRLIEVASRIVTLEPGDLILTGTPAGVGKPSGQFLSVGDVLLTEAEGIGQIRNTVT